MLKVQTIEQFKIMQFLNAHLEISLMKVELINRNTIKVTDASGDTITFKYENGSVKWE